MAPRFKCWRRGQLSDFISKLSFNKLRPLLEEAHRYERAEADPRGLAEDGRLDMRIAAA
jgi:hypothetical protein